MCYISTDEDEQRCPETLEKHVQVIFKRNSKKFHLNAVIVKKRLFQFCL